MKTRLITILIISLAVFSCNNKINNGEELIKGMRTTYNGKWYQKIAFEQNSYFYKNDSIYKKQVWYETYQFPGKLTIKFDSITSGSGYLFSKDTLSIFSSGELTSQRRRIHDLVVLSMDIYSQEVSKTVEQLNELGYDLSKMHSNTWAGQDVFVVGANEGDTLSTQFWIEKERLLLLRTLSIENGKYKEIIFNDYTKFNDSWIEQTVIFKLNNKVDMKEEYFNIREPKDINPHDFDPENFVDLFW